MKKLFTILFLILLVVCPNTLFATSRAVQIDILLSGLIDPNTLLPVASGTVYFYEAGGTSTAKNVWTEKEKTNPYTSYTLSSAGVVQLYGEGEYCIVVKDSSGSTLYTWDYIRLKYPNYYIRSISANHTQVSQDDFLLVDTTSAQVTITCIAAADWDDGMLKVKRVSGSNNIVIDPNGSETINGASTLTISDDNAHEIISDGSNLLVANSRSKLSDADNDTKVEVEQSSDEDLIRFTTATNERGFLGNGGGAGETFQDSYLEFNAHTDADGDTKVQVEEGIDDDTIRFDTGGSQRAYIDSTGLVVGTSPTGGGAVFVDNSNGDPNISDTMFNIGTSLAATTWESVSSTTGGGDNTWAALDGVPTDIDWVVIRIVIEAQSSSGSQGDTHNVTVNGRDDGSSEAAGEANFLAQCAVELDSAGDGYCRTSVEAHIPVTSAVFELYFAETYDGSVSLHAYLVGYGYNK